MARVCFVTLALCLLVISSQCHQQTQADQIQLSLILPKLQAIHEDSKSLLNKNVELKTRIAADLQTQSKFNIQNEENKMIKNGQAQTVISNSQVTPLPHPSIDYSELEEFNKWVEINLDYAVKNTRASIDALKEEAQANNGNVEYSEQAIKDGIEGVKYWQSAVIFQDKTLKNEKFDVE